MKKQIAVLSLTTLLTLTSVFANTGESPSESSGSVPEVRDEIRDREPAVADAEESLLSPYFIDDVHCVGIEASSSTLRWLVPKDELKAADAASNREECEDVLALFGVTKHGWYSLEDLERISTTIRMANLYQKVDISIKKSELKNHVHLFLKVEPKKYSRSTTLRLAGSASPWAKAGRKTHSIRGSGDFFQGAGLPKSSNELGLDFETGGVKSATRNLPFTVIDLSGKTFGQVSEKWSYQVSAGLSIIAAEDYLAQNQPKLNTLPLRVEADILHGGYSHTLRGNSKWGPTLWMGSRPLFSSGTGPIYAPGVVYQYQTGVASANHMNLRVSFHLSTELQFASKYEYHGQYGLGVFDLFTYGDFEMKSGWDRLRSIDALPFDLFDDDRASLGLTRYFGTSVSSHQVSLGLEMSTKSLMKSSGQYELMSVAKYQFRGEHLNIGLSFGLGLPGFSL